MKQACDPHFVRCIKPNRANSPAVWEEEYVLAQLKYTGMLETIRIRKEGFAVRPVTSPRTDTTHTAPTAQIWLRSEPFSIFVRQLSCDVACLPPHERRSLFTIGLPPCDQCGFLVDRAVRLTKIMLPGEQAKHLPACRVLLLGQPAKHLPACRVLMLGQQQSIYLHVLC
jgi:hypothetical protein